MKSVEGVTVITEPKPGGKNAQSLAIVELSGKASLGKLLTALEAAKTPHAEKAPPGAEAVIPGRLKPTATPEAIMSALDKAGLTASEKEEAEVK
ncbi:MAG TPA: hypothetical protein VFB38_02810 [Chthonomonadaceae bacterium]|nr:hypothetical protein [Chthonomonadaceae bacterium]